MSHQSDYLVYVAVACICYKVILSNNTNIIIGVEILLQVGNQIPTPRASKVKWQVT